MTRPDATPETLAGLIIDLAFQNDDEIALRAISYFTPSSIAECLDEAKRIAFHMKHKIVKGD